VILVHLFGSSEKAELVSFPRDSYVEIPAYTNPKTGHVTPAHHDKLNSSFAIGGPTLLIKTIENLSHIRVDHFLQIDFTGFKGMVNKLGGVDVCLTKPAKDHFSGIDLSVGNHHISGDVALAFVRHIDRIARQQQFIGSLVHKVLSAGTLLDPFKLTGFLDVATKSVQADTGLTGNDIRNLALRLRHFSSGGVLFTTVPITTSNGYRSGQSVVLLDDAKLATMFDALGRDVAPDTPAAAKPGTTTPATPIIVAPSNVQVAVFNGSSIPGKGRTAAADIARFGFQVIGVPTTRGTGATQTTVFYGPTKADSAHTLQASIPGSALQADPNLGGTLDLVVGSSDKGAQKVSVTPVKPSPGSKPGVIAAPPVKTAQDNPCTT
jgi:LCP family protein required for cell wall assembly